MSEGHFRVRCPRGQARAEEGKFEENRSDFVVFAGRKQAPTAAFPLSTRYWAYGQRLPQFVVQNKVAETQHIGC